MTMSSEARATTNLLSPWVCYATAFVGSLVVLSSLLAGPVLRAVLTDSVEVASALLICFGISRNLGAEPMSVRRSCMLFVPWLLCAAVGDAIWDTLDLTGAKPSFSITAADPFYLLSYVFMGWAIVRLVRRRSTQDAREALVDGVIFAVAALVVIWVFLGPDVHAPHQRWFEVVLLGAYPMLDVLLVAGLAWLVLMPGLRPRALYLVLAHLVVTLIADLVWMALSRYSPSSSQSLLDLLWPLADLLLAVAVLHPSVREIGYAHEGVAAQHRHGVPVLRLSFLSTALFVAAAVVVLAGPRPIGDRLILLAASLMLVSLVLWRVASLLAEKERAQVELRAMYAELARSQERLNHQATHDALTGLLNRGELMRLMHQTLRSRPAQASGAVLFVDLDSFKEVNDEQGHAVGDALLMVLAARLQGAVRPGDVVARFGGDEFVVLLPRASEEEAVIVAERVIERCVQPVVALDVRLTVGASVGVTVMRGPADADAVLRSADAAMYDAKRNGRSGYSLRRLAA